MGSMESLHGQWWVCGVDGVFWGFVGSVGGGGTKGGSMEPVEGLWGSMGSMEPMEGLWGSMGSMEDLWCQRRLYKVSDGSVGVCGVNGVF